MKTFILSALFTAGVCYPALAQHQGAIKQQAQLIADAVVKEDYNTVLNYTYPKFINAHGGKDSVLRAIKTGLEGMKTQGMGFAIISATIGDVGPETPINDTLYCVVPETIVIKIKGSTYSTNSSLVALSTDKGKNWWFVDAGNPDSLEELLPNVKKLNIPKQTGPVLQQ